MKTFTAKVYVRNGSTRTPHTIQFNAETSFSAQQMLSAQYGANNIISVPTEVTGYSSSGNNAPWMIKIG